MRHPALAFATTALILAMSGPAPAAEKPRNTLIYKVDSVSAQVTGRKLTITASGAVRSGGWENPHLRVVPQRGTESQTLTVEFLADPPPADAAVIQALLPVSATTTIALPRKMTTVTVKAETNTASAAVE